MTVRDLANLDVKTCIPDTDLAKAAKINDLVVRADTRAGAAFLDTMKAICAHTREAVTA